MYQPEAYARPLRQVWPANTESTHCPVNSHNEWDLLEEVIVGIVDGASFPPWHDSLKAPLPHDQHQAFRKHAGKPFPPEKIAAAKKELEEFVRILEAEGVKVRRPVPVDQLKPYGAPGWTSTGLYAAMPRDLLLVFGNEIIECPLAWRSRYCEAFAYRPLLKEYFNAGAKWSAGPKPELKDDFYDSEWAEPKEGEPSRFVISEYEPTFDASCDAAVTSSRRRATSRTSSASSGCAATWGISTESTFSISMIHTPCT
jgi:glycine amidinotransferase